MNLLRNSEDERYEKGGKTNMDIGTLTTATAQSGDLAEVARRAEDLGREVHPEALHRRWPPREGAAGHRRRRLTRAPATATPGAGQRPPPGRQ